MAGENAAGVISGSSHERRLKWMVDPLSETDEEAAKRNYCGGNRGKGRENSCAGGQKHNDTHDHEHLVPIIERKLGKRIIHWLLGRS